MQLAFFFFIFCPNVPCLVDMGVTNGFFISIEFSQATCSFKLFGAFICCFNLHLLHVR